MAAKHRICAIVYLLLNMLRNMVFLKLPSNIKPTGNTFIVGNAVLTAPLTPCVTAPEGLAIILTSIPLRKSTACTSAHTIR